jgi:hypothetical protein
MISLLLRRQSGTQAEAVLSMPSDSAGGRSDRALDEAARPSQALNLDRGLHPQTRRLGIQLERPACGEERIEPSDPAGVEGGGSADFSAHVDASHSERAITPSSARKAQVREGWDSV